MKFLKQLSISAKTYEVFKTIKYLGWNLVSFWAIRRNENWRMLKTNFKENCLLTASIAACSADLVAENTVKDTLLINKYVPSILFQLPCLFSPHHYFIKWFANKFLF